MLVHAHEVLNKLLGVVGKISQIRTHWNGFIEIFEVEILVRWSTVGQVAIAGSLEVLFGDLDLFPESIQGFGHERSSELHLVDELAQEKLKKY